MLCQDNDKYLRTACWLFYAIRLPCHAIPWCGTTTAYAIMHFLAKSIVQISQLHEPQLACMHAGMMAGSNLRLLPGLKMVPPPPPPPLPPPPLPAAGMNAQAACKQAGKQASRQTDRQDKRGVFFFFILCLHSPCCFLTYGISGSSI